MDISLISSEADASQGRALLYRVCQHTGYDQPLQAETKWGFDPSVKGTIAKYSLLASSAWDLSHLTHPLISIFL